MIYSGRPPFVAGSDTSEDAANSVASITYTLRRKAFEAIDSCRDGATCDELEVLLYQRHQTISARLRELCLRNLIYDTGVRRMTRSGRSARVYKLTQWAVTLLEAERKAYK